ncbi:MAG: hypothetical protein SGJ10_00405 [Bacteroidota bacterium]|nr:hypothetical protein [Bacteroidota bacterium]
MKCKLTLTFIILMSITANAQKQTATFSDGQTKTWTLNYDNSESMKKLWVGVGIISPVYFEDWQRLLSVDAHLFPTKKASFVFRKAALFDISENKRLPANWLGFNGSYYFFENEKLKDGRISIDGGGPNVSYNIGHKANILVQYGVDLGYVFGKGSFNAGDDSNRNHIYSNYSSNILAVGLSRISRNLINFEDAKGRTKSFEHFHNMYIHCLLTPGFSYDTPPATVSSLDIRKIGVRVGFDSYSSISGSLILGFGLEAGIKPNINATYLNVNGDGGYYGVIKIFAMGFNAIAPK